ncbi:hypothetical protein [Pseudomonas phage vB_Pae_CF127b]|uniref:Uncharacterized protein n=1 Tax=Pseudomonas phage vB_Pae_CF78a TaxID=2563592 RepID=A0A481V7S3_9CAUD|nr:hypothetical protein QJS23_gp18 [Pseudomonas phage vB_Pae_CF78a]QBI83653.1 hypothetical protein [Pseudomonas phage vB_Pae_CF5a]QBI83709.1 hypothetical protein [Pseudomonas phage vB_Pae_CF53b]QBI83813.1 hypothetical protein [Pseudomonas phage vB_Pae_CF118c]QBI83860.1 hypothetical protein [Pseudomonas phage vB_Pae_CF125a]QBI83917.1 hypothetical protein [Pseudomonas phage vB_Pae_CF127b]QBI83962.1 hypothetical protein [Pseudomonas phage vB_Pae_CF177a]QBI84020.1 hypothetical protein [Pseudomon
MFVSPTGVNVPHQVVIVATALPMAKTAICLDDDYWGFWSAVQ